MATTSQKPPKRKRKTTPLLGDTEQPVVVMQNKKSVAETLFKTTSDDSALKTVVVYTAAAFIAYYGGRMLLGSVSKAHKESVLAQEEEKAVTTVNTAAALAAQLKNALSEYGNTDEQVIWDIFEGKKIMSREYFNEVAASYAIQTKGRKLLDDLYNNLDPAIETWKPDWTRLKPTLDTIRRTPRASLKLKKSLPKKK